MGTAISFHVDTFEGCFRFVPRSCDWGTFIDWFLGKMGFAKHLKLSPSANRLVTGSDRIHDALEPSQYHDVSHACSTMRSFSAKCFCNPGTNLMLLSRASSRNSFCHYFWRNLTQYKFRIRDRRATRSRVSEIHKLLISVVQNHVLFKVFKK